MMNVLVTAGNTRAPIDSVRYITNAFSGRTGSRIAATAFDRGHAVTLLTSHPEVIDAIPQARPRLPPGWRVRPYSTYDDLETLMAEQIWTGGFDAVIHAAAVSDYRIAGIFAPNSGTSFNSSTLRWTSDAEGPEFVDAAAGKVTSSHPELWLQLAPCPKLVDKVRMEWRFEGILVKFKLEVGISEADLLKVAERSRTQSAADLMVANTLEGMHDWAFIGAGMGSYARVSRTDLPKRLIGAVEALAAREREVADRPEAK